ncbi:hypothetical protein KA005_32010 [bacterium]|nr:hypothetical protein [bacterium]
MLPNFELRVLRTVVSKDTFMNSPTGLYQIDDVNLQFYKEKLQYRTRKLRDGLIVKGWSEWQDVPIVEE